MVGSWNINIIKSIAAFFILIIFGVIIFNSSAYTDIIQTIEFGNPEKYSEKAARAFIENLWDYCILSADSYTEMVAKFNGRYNEENTDINSEYYEE